MDTQQFVQKLASDLESGAGVSSRAIGPRLAFLTALASLVSLAVILLVLSRSPHFAHSPSGTIVFTALAGVALAGCAFRAAIQLSFPDNRISFTWLVLPLAILASGIGWELARTPSLSWASRLWGDDPLACFLCVTGLSLPILAAILLALRHGAPSFPRLAGAAAGLLAGGITATLYTIHCPENSLLFIASWHGLAVLAVTLIGAFAGKRYLRW